MYNGIRNDIYSIFIAVIMRTIFGKIMAVSYGYTALIIGI